jgi:signal transduction histidine kinase
LRQVLAVSLFLLLIFFWWAFVYIFLLAGWGALNGIDFRTESGYVWWNMTDWIFMGLALLTAWPMQRWLRTQIAHFLDQMDNPYAIISQFSAGIATTTAADSLLENLVRLLAETLHVPYAGIATEDTEMAAEYGVPTADKAITLPLQYDGAPLGTLRICPRRVGGAPIRVDERLLGDLARQVSLTLHAAQLSADLQESRRRIVTAREEARRQLRRDLHDGLGPALATMTMQADTARELLHDDPQAAEALLARLADQAQATVAEVRRIVHGLRPPALDDMGLYGALEVLANGFVTPGLHVTLELPGARPASSAPAGAPVGAPIGAAVEVAVYRIAQEALTNIAKHARAQAATVTLTVTATELALTICDDGVGMTNRTGAGLGLHSMRARAEELGGTLAIRPNTPTGCCVVTRFPLEATEPYGTDPHADL